MTGGELLDYIRTDILRDSAAPFLWSDALILRLLTEAQRQHARKTYSITDNTKIVTTVIGAANYTVPAGTLHFLSAKVSTRTIDLKDYTRKVIPNHLLDVRGEPQLYTLDEATNTIRFYPVPDAVYTINTRIARLPTNAIAAYSTPEIPERYHIDLADYVAWQCLQNNDVDGQSLGAADRHRADWNLKVADAKREFYRLQLGANPNVRVNWTGKRN